MNPAKLNSKIDSSGDGGSNSTSNSCGTFSDLHKSGTSGTSSSAVLLTIPFPWISLITVLMPLVAFVYCIVYSFFYHYEWTTQTHCNVWNFAPSISAAIGLFRPQKYVWKMFVSLHSAPRHVHSGKFAHFFKITYFFHLYFH